MTRQEALFADMRRWTAITQCLKLFSDRERDIILSLFDREPESVTAARNNLTRPQLVRRRKKCLQILTDMLFTAQTPPDPKSQLPQ